MKIEIERQIEELCFGDVRPREVFVDFQDDVLMKIEEQIWDGPNAVSLVSGELRHFENEIKIHRIVKTATLVEE